MWQNFASDWSAAFLKESQAKLEHINFILNFMIISYLLLIFKSGQIRWSPRNKTRLLRKVCIESLDLTNARPEERVRFLIRLNFAVYQDTIIVPLETIMYPDVYY